MIFINLPLAGQFGSTTYVTANVAHIACVTQDNQRPAEACYVNMGNNSWQIEMSKDAVLNEIKGALEQARQQALAGS